MTTKVTIDRVVTSRIALRIKLLAFWDSTDYISDNSVFCVHVFRSVLASE